MEKPNYDRFKIQAFILDHFLEDEVIDFCEMNFTEVLKYWSNNTNLSQRVRILVRYCFSHGFVETLIEALKEERPKIFTDEPHKFDFTLAAQADGMRTLDDVRAGEEEYSELLDGTPPTTKKRKSVKAAGASNHPLAGGPAEIKSWLLSEFQLDEQLFLLSAALFPGLEWAELDSLYFDILSLFDAGESSPPPVEKSAEPSNHQDHFIHINVSVDGSQMGVSPEAAEVPLAQKPSLKDEARLLEMANLIFVAGERNREFGMTPVTLVDFADDKQRLKIIHLFRDNFPSVLWRILPYLRTAGAEGRAVIRRRAAQTAGELMCEVDFSKVKDEILMPWALSANPYLNANVAYALAVPAKNERFRENVKLVLNEWAKSPNHSLNWTAIAALTQIGELWPEHTLNLLEAAIKKEDIDLLVLVFMATRKLLRTEYQFEVLGRLRGWAAPDAKDPERAAALLIFLDQVELEDVVKDPLTDYSAEIFLVGLFDHSLRNYKYIQPAVLAKLQSWLETAFQTAPSAEMGDEHLSIDELRQTVEALVIRLLQSAPNERSRKHLHFYLPRWSKTIQSDEYAAFVSRVKSND